MSPRNIINLLGSVATMLLGVKLAGLTVNLRLFPTLRPIASDNGDLAGVALLIPMRNEIERLPNTLTGFLTSGAATITFLDDESTDGSADHVEAAAIQHEQQVRVIAGLPRPDGWAGKTWACAQLADSVSADVLVFCDADVVLAPGALNSLIHEMRRQNAQLFSIFPRQLVGTWGERILIPLINNTLLCFLPFPLLSAPVPAAATANGSILAFTSDAYRELNAFTAVKASLVEDISIAHLTRAGGFTLGLALGGDLVSVRMFANFQELVQGLGRGLSPVGGRHPVVLAAAWLTYVALYTLPPFLAKGHRRWRWVAALGIVERILVEAKSGNRDWVAALASALAPPAAVPVLRQAVNQTQTWKARTYR